MPPKKLYRNVQGSFIHISKTTQISKSNPNVILWGSERISPSSQAGPPLAPSNVQMEKQIGIYTYNGALRANENDTHNHMDNSQKHCTSAMAQ